MSEEVLTQEEQTQEEQTTEQASDKVEFNEVQQKHINKLIAQQRSKAVEDFKKQQENEKSEAKKLSKMNDNEKLQYEFEKIKAELEEAKSVKARYEMEKVATSILNEHNLPVNEQVLSFVVKADAEQTQEAIKTLSQLVNDTAEALLKERNKGNIPTRSNSNVKASWEKWL
jgi:BH3529 protein|nr:MAG TPA: Major head protein [Caudoviricetes sp.]